MSEDFLVTVIAVFCSEHFCTNEGQPTCKRAVSQINLFNKSSKCKFEYWEAGGEKNETWKTFEIQNYHSKIDNHRRNSGH